MSIGEADQLVEQLADNLRARNKRISTAESCTGGLIAKSLTDLAGSSDWFDRGFVTYSNASKSEMLGVAAETIESHGAVSEPVARAMATGVLQHSAADYAVAVTGVAGPGGGTVEKPVGTVWIAVASSTVREARLYLFDGDRSAVRDATLLAALQAVLGLIDND